ncbi:uncharacterized protein PRCAT00004918001 [Priceomyces carsonii]|uniref:uncharacterized protein n=1 Tax=Priceomyces carsonii TaxID=28549 RepID=UPI002ED97C28|nr:unnamed protein product [Priceomyces carsonii]
MSEENQIYKRAHLEDRSPFEAGLSYSREAFDEENDGLLPVSHQDVKEPSTLKPKANNKSKGLSKKDRPAFSVLVILYMLQGVPVGLAFGSVPFILKSKLSYSQVGIFSLAAYPYSLKLLWSPIVDALYSRKFGRRKSWIVPIQTISGTIMVCLGLKMDILMKSPELHLTKITACFFLLVLFCATQDIAVDGWALTCLSPESLSYASTAQTVGINTGYFLSFTIFLALSSPDFANKYLRLVSSDEGIFSLGLYLKFWGWIYLLVTLVLYFIPEDPPHLAKKNNDKLISEKVKVEDVYNQKFAQWASLKRVYFSMYQVLKLPNVQTFVIILLIAKFPFQVNEAATNLKLLEKGLSKEDLSITVLIDFPFELIFGYYAGRWSTGTSPLKPWLVGFCGRLIAAVLAHIAIYFFPESGEISTGYFILILLQHLFSSFMSTIQFVSLCAFETKIADPAIGGTYMTTLNTLSNYGGTWPRLMIFFLIDKLSYTVCEPPLETQIDPELFNYRITSESLKAQCKTLKGTVHTYRDGYYYMNFICVSIGVLMFFWIKAKTLYLQSLPNGAWRVNKDD